jgi:multidrug resistance protein
MSTKAAFSPYQKLIIVISSVTQFSVILDFMVLSPLGAILMPKLQLSTAQFGTVVSAYAFSAGISGLLSAGFADRFDRKKMLLFFYVGFLIGTVFCALAQTYYFLLFARIFTGVFGGVIGSIGFAIVTDLFKYEVRGRVMGYIQMSFAVSQIMGLPIGLYLANKFDWHAPFWFVVAIGLLVVLLIWFKMQPITKHIAEGKLQNPLAHMKHNISKPMHVRGFFGTVLLATGGFMLMPFGSAFSTNNLGLSMSQLPILYFITGLFSIAAGPIVGKLTDKLGTMKVFSAGSILVIITVYQFRNYPTLDNNNN